MGFILYLFIFVFGAIVGSFLNCVIYRIELQASLSKASPKKKSLSFLQGRSFCPHCRHQLGFWDLIPVVSFIALRGKCRYCKEKISWQYPAVEILTGLIFLLIFNFQFSISKQFSIYQFINFQTVASLLYLWITASLLIVVFVYDLKHYIIPDKVIYAAIGAALLYKAIFNFQFSISKQFSINQFSNFQTNSFWPSILSGFLAALFFFLIWAISRGKWMGFGDVKLAFFMGLFLGWPSILVALFSAFLIGGIIGIGLIAFGKKNLKSQVPFGPFLITGTFIALFYGEQIIRWYLSLI